MPSLFNGLSFFKYIFFQKQPLQEPVNYKNQVKISRNSTILQIKKASKCIKHKRHSLLSASDIWTLRINFSSNECLMSCISSETASRGVLRLKKTCFESLQQIYTRTPTPWNHSWNHSSAWVFPCKFAAYF